jgi:hypothetical protein
MTPVAAARETLEPAFNAMPRKARFAEVRGVGVDDTTGLAYVAHENVEGEPLATWLCNHHEDWRARFFGEMQNLAAAIDDAISAGVALRRIALSDVVMETAPYYPYGLYGRPDPPRIRIRDATLERAFDRNPNRPSGAVILRQLAIETWSAVASARADAGPAPEWLEVPAEPGAKATEWIPPVRVGEMVIPWERISVRL